MPEAKPQQVTVNPAAERMKLMDSVGDYARMMERIINAQGEQIQALTKENVELRAKSAPVEGD